MDVARFGRELSLLYDDFPHSEVPRDRRFREVLEAVPGLAREDNLALLNLAASCLGPGEVYLEAGSFRGTSLIAAGLGNHVDLVSIDDFSKADASSDELRANLERFRLPRVDIREGDVLETLRQQFLGGRRVGVYYYDADHSYESQLAGLRLVEPHLAGRALLIVDDSDWEAVGRATADYVAGEPRASLIFELPGNAAGRPGWWEGMQVIAWAAP